MYVMIPRMRMVRRLHTGWDLSVHIFTQSLSLFLCYTLHRSEPRNHRWYSTGDILVIASFGEGRIPGMRQPPTARRPSYYMYWQLDHEHHERLGGMVIIIVSQSLFGSYL